jgi:polyhydroxybutyrate depolymerase
MLTGNKFLICTLLVTVCLASCRKDQAADQDTAYVYANGLSTQSIQVAGINRTFLVYRPADLTQPKAIVFVLHGGGGSGATGTAEGDQSPLSVFKAVADTGRFFVIYPQGQADAQGTPSWNDCRSDNVLGRSADDVLFFDSLVNRLTIQTGLGKQQVFMCGVSNGGLMTYRYAFERPGNLRAIAAGIANLAALPAPGACATGAATPLPAVLFFGTADPFMPAAGGCVANVGGACGRGTVVSADSTRWHWLRANGLQATTPVVTTFDVNTNDAGNVTKYVYPGRYPVSLFQLNNAGHSAPSKMVSTPSSTLTGVQNRDVEFATEVWQFFTALF